MSKINLTPNASGTGVFTIASPNSNTDYTINLPEISGGEFVATDASGNVGIGTDSPAAPLQVEQTAAAVTNTSDLGLVVGQSSGTMALNSAVGLGFRMQNTAGGPVGGNNMGAAIYGLQDSTGTNTGALSFHTRITNGSFPERMRIDSSGKLLVGSTTSVNGSASTLQVLASSTSSGGLVAAQPNGASSATLRAQSVSTASTSWYQFLGQSGNGSTITTNNIFIYGNGNIVNSNNSYGAISDASLKSNIVDASSQIDDIMAVQVRSYTLNETGDTHIGVVAQELEASGMNGLVEEDGEGVKSVKYSVLYMKAIKALQEAVAKIEDLESRLSAVEAN